MELPDPVLGEDDVVGHLRVEVHVPAPVFRQGGRTQHDVPPAVPEVAGSDRDLGSTDVEPDAQTMHQAVFVERPDVPASHHAYAGDQVLGDVRPANEHDVPNRSAPTVPTTVHALRAVRVRRARDGCARTVAHTALQRRITVLLWRTVRVLETTRRADVLVADLARGTVVTHAPRRDGYQTHLPKTVAEDTAILARPPVLESGARLLQLVAKGLLGLASVLAVALQGKLVAARAHRAVHIRVAIKPNVYARERPRRTPALRAEVAVITHGIGRVALRATLDRTQPLETEAEVEPPLTPVHAGGTDDHVVPGLERRARIVIVEQTLTIIAEEVLAASWVAFLLALTAVVVFVRADAIIPATLVHGGRVELALGHVTLDDRADVQLIHRLATTAIRLGVADAVRLPAYVHGARVAVVAVRIALADPLLGLHRDATSVAAGHRHDEKHQ